MKYIFVPQYIGDDVLAELALKYHDPAQACPSTVVTTDKDLLQLIRKSRAIMFRSNKMIHLVWE